jgi:geranylgeranyl diphosphate synthase type I
MDGSATRRGESTTHERFAQQHHASEWAGESRRFGEGVAILVGDLVHVYADQLLQGEPQAAWQVWNEMRIELNVGQYLDMLGSATSERSRAKAERVCRYKSAKYTIERPLHLGAVLANPDRATELMVAFSAYGIPLGDAFQMRDDVLGAFGDTATTGKPVGDDLREGKPTPLMAIATEHANASQLQVLQLVGHARLTDAQVADVQRVIRETGALDQLEAEISNKTDEAIAAIQQAPITDVARDELVALAAYVSWRSV